MDSSKLGGQSGGKVELIEWENTLISKFQTEKFFIAIHHNIFLDKLLVQYWLK